MLREWTTAALVGRVLDLISEADLYHSLLVLPALARRRSSGRSVRDDAASGSAHVASLLLRVRGLLADPGGMS